VGVEPDGARFLLIVEKECIFRRLCEDRVWEQPGLRCIVVTGCGQPDLATRAFVKQIAQAHGPGFPLLGLADCNPFGLQILLTYAHGSAAHPEASCFAVPQLQWLGLRCSDIGEFALPASALQPMGHLDCGRATAQLQLQHISSCEQLSSEVRCWLEDGRKMELEGLLAGGIGFLAHSYLPQKLGLEREWPGEQAGWLNMAHVDALPLGGVSAMEEEEATHEEEEQQTSHAAAMQPEEEGEEEQW